MPNGVAGPKPQPAIRPLAKPAVTAAEAADVQRKWAEHLGVQVEEKNSIGMRLMLIPPGEFDLGSTAEEVARASEEGKHNNPGQWYFDQLPKKTPQHHVKITKPFFLAMHQVTQGEYKKVMGVNPMPSRLIRWRRLLSDLPYPPGGRIARSI